MEMNLSQGTVLMNGIRFVLRVMSWDQRMIYEAFLTHRACNRLPAFPISGIRVTLQFQHITCHGSWAELWRVPPRRVDMWAWRPMSSEQILPIQWPQDREYLYRVPSLAHLARIFPYWWGSTDRKSGLTEIPLFLVLFCYLVYRWLIFLKWF